MKQNCPKWIQELYGPISSETWQKWLSFCNEAGSILSSTECTWEKARAFYDAAGIVRNGLSRAGLHSSSSLTTKRPFPWCGVHLYTGFASRSISLDVETHDSDIRTIAEYQERL